MAHAPSTRKNIFFSKLPVKNSGTPHRTAGFFLKIHSRLPHLIQKAREMFCLLPFIPGNPMYLHIIMFIIILLAHLS